MKVNEATQQAQVDGQSFFEALKLLFDASNHNHFIRGSTFPVELRMSSRRFEVVSCLWYLEHNTSLIRLCLHRLFWRLMMELKGINNDVLGNIMSRLEGTSLASVACSCSDLRELARDEAHWKRLCNLTWPSTELEQAHRLISASNSGGFAQFYSSSFPLIVYDHKAITSEVVGIDTLPGDLVSLVDVFLNDKCVLSRVLDGIPTNDSGLQLDGSGIGEKGSESLDVYPSADQSEELMRGALRLSWIIMDKKSGRAVNLSSWKPLSIQMNGPYDDSCVAQFGCILPVQPNALPHKLAKCVITTGFKIGPDFAEGSFHWKKLSLAIEDIEGVQVNGETSLKVLNQALSTSTSSINHLRVEEGLSRFEEEKSRTSERKEFADKLAGRLFILMDTAAFVTCCYILRRLF